MLLGRLPCSSSLRDRRGRSEQKTLAKMGKWDKRDAMRHAFWDVSVSRRDNPAHTLDHKYLFRNIDKGG